MLFYRISLLAQKKITSTFQVLYLFFVALCMSQYAVSSSTAALMVGVSLTAFVYLPFLSCGIKNRKLLCPF